MMICRVIVALSILLSGAAFAQQTQTVGEYTVHYSAFPSGFLAPDVAREYGILRSRAKGVLLVSVRREGASTAVQIDAQSGPGGGRMQPLQLRAVTTEGMVSYIGSFPIADGESRQFLLRIVPPNAEPMTVSFSQEFFEDN